VNRRRFLGVLGTSGLVASAGCLNEVGGVTDAGGVAPTAAAERGLSASRDVSLPVPESDLVRATSRDAIPAITEPAFGPDWADLPGETFDPPTLADADMVVGVDVGGVTRAYPLAVLTWHEVVNDTLPTPDGGLPLLVTYCPLCRSAVVADRTVDGSVSRFGVSGYLYESDLVLYDTATDSLWSQVLARAIRGPRTGARLTLRPNTLATWGEWREAYPDTDVLLPPPASGTVAGRVTHDYDRDPYSGDGRRTIVSVGVPDDVDTRIPPNVTVLGVTHRGTTRAYPADRVAEAGAVNDRIAGLPVVVTTTPGGELVAYVRRIGGRTYRFFRDGNALAAARSRWDPTSGRALDGPHAGTKLRRANDRSPMFWFAWAGFYPETELWHPRRGPRSGDSS
jgi:hypothetical protein